MKLLSFQRLDEGERFADAVIVLWRVDAVNDDGYAFRAFGMTMMLPVPILSKYRDVSLDALMRGWRLPRMLAYVTRPRGGPRSGRWTPVFRCGMHAVGVQELLAYGWQIEDGIYPPKEGAN